MPSVRQWCLSAAAAYVRVGGVGGASVAVLVVGLCSASVAALVVGLIPFVCKASLVSILASRMRWRQASSCSLASRSISRFLVADGVMSVESWFLARFQVIAAAPLSVGKYNLR